MDAAACIARIFNTMEYKGTMLVDGDKEDILWEWVEELKAVKDVGVTERAKQCRDMLQSVPEKKRQELASCMVKHIWDKFRITVDEMCESRKLSMSNFDGAKRTIDQLLASGYSECRYNMVRDILRNINALSGVYTPEQFDTIICTTGFSGMREAIDMLL